MADAAALRPTNRAMDNCRTALMSRAGKARLLNLFSNTADDTVHRQTRSSTMVAVAQLFPACTARTSFQAAFDDQH